MVCDSSATADHIYTTLDGTEFLKTANVFDLQFIYDSMEFKYPAHDIATEVYYLNILYLHPYFLNKGRLPKDPETAFKRVVAIINYTEDLVKSHQL